MPLAATAMTTSPGPRAARWKSAAAGVGRVLVGAGVVEERRDAAGEEHRRLRGRDAEGGGDLHGVGERHQARAAGAGVADAAAGVEGRGDRLGGGGERGQRRGDRGGGGLLAVEQPGEHLGRRQAVEVLRLLVLRFGAADASC